MKKQGNIQTVEATLNYKNGERYVSVKGRKGVTTPEVLMHFLKRGLDNNEIKKGVKAKLPIHSKYTFDVYEYNERLGTDVKSQFVVKVKNDEKHLFNDTLKQMDDMCVMSAQVKKINKLRILAGIGFGACFLTFAGPKVVNGLIDMDNARLEAEYDNTKEQVDKLRPNHVETTPEERIETEKDYYKNLLEKARDGDLEAISECAKRARELGQELPEEFEENTEEKVRTR